MPFPLKGRGAHAPPTVCLRPIGLGGLGKPHPRRHWRHRPPVFPPGLRVGLEPPVGMTPSARFPGFEDPGTMPSIAILDLPLSAYRSSKPRHSTKSSKILISQTRELPV